MAGYTCRMKPAWWLRALARLPLPILYACAAVLAFVVHRVLRHRVGVARANLRAAFPQWTRAEVSRVLAAHYRGLMQVVVETLALADISAEELRARVRFSNFELVQQQLRAGHPVMLLAAHQCNWEWLLQVLALDLGVPLTAAYKPLHSAAADAQMRALRSRFGAHMVAAKKLLREVLRRRGTVQAVAFMADQVPRSSVTRHWLMFLGRETAFYPGPAEIALRTGLVPFFMRLVRVRRGYYEVLFEPLAEPGEAFAPGQLTARYAARIEAQIRAHPADWTWTHRRWKLQRHPDEPLQPVSG